MLSAMQKVDAHTMDDLKAIFESMDETKSNTIQVEDLILIAQKGRSIGQISEAG